jgi:D-serine dehydratase
MTRLGSVLEALDARALDGYVRNAPMIPGLSGASLGALGLDLFDERIPYPQMVVRWPDVLHNVRTMQAYCDSVGAWIAPHGKTTMAPHIFAAQLDAGAWGITVASTQQARVCRTLGVDRILLANDVRRPGEMRWLVEELRADPAFELLALVDDRAHVDAWIAAARSAALARPVPLLIEFGMAGWRTGTRRRHDVESVAVAVRDGWPWVALAGVEGYEGLAPGADGPERLAAADAYLETMAEVATTIVGSVTADQPIVSAGGSSYFDRVVAHLGRGALPEYQLILRSGGYVTHDSGLYERSSPLSAGPGRLTGHGHLSAALELWGTVLSRPEAGLAIAGFGHRDAPSRIDLPVVRFHRQNGESRPIAVEPPVAVRRMDDQHAYIDLAGAFDPNPNDLIGCGISHPCEAFDRWRVMLTVDEHRQVIGAIPTFF